jgi:hypothetical protein
VHNKFTITVLVVYPIVVHYPSTRLASAAISRHRPGTSAHSGDSGQ